MDANGLIKKLGIDVDLLHDINALMERGEHYLYSWNGSGVWNKYNYTRSGVEFAKSYIKRLNQESKRIEKITGKLGYDIKQRKHPNIWIYSATCLYLKSKGYRDCSIAFIMNKHRTTIVTIWERIEPYQNDRIANSVIQTTINELETAL